MKELVCICCPLGCRLQVEEKKNEGAVQVGELVAQTAEDSWQVTGNRCPRGKAYAISELTDPRRTVTTTVRVTGGSRPCVAVKTGETVPKARMQAVIQDLAKVSVSAPIHIGDVILEDVAGTGVAVVATADLEATGESEARFGL